MLTTFIENVSNSNSLVDFCGPLALYGNVSESNYDLIIPSGVEFHPDGSCSLVNNTGQSIGSVLSPEKYPVNIQAIVNTSNRLMYLPIQPSSSTNILTTYPIDTLTLYLQQKYNYTIDPYILDMFRNNRSNFLKTVYTNLGLRNYSFDGFVVYNKHLETISECFALFNAKSIESLTSNIYIVDRDLIINRSIFIQLFESYIEEKKYNGNINFKRLVELYFLELNCLDIRSNSTQQDYSEMNIQFTDIIRKDKDIVNYATYMKILNSMK